MIVKEVQGMSEGVRAAASSALTNLCACVGDNDAALHTLADPFIGA